MRNKVTSKIIVKHQEITIEIVGTNPVAMVKQYKDILWELGLPVQGGDHPFAKRRVNEVYSSFR